MGGGVSEIEFQTPLRRPRGRPSREEQARIRAWIVDCAWQEFVDRGYGQATTQRIAERAGVSIATYYKHFPDKTQIFVEAMQKSNEAMLASLVTAPEGKHLEGALQAFSEAFVEQFNQTRYAECARLIYAEAARFPELVVQFERLVRPWMEVLAKIIGQERPDWSESLCMDMAGAFLDMIGGRMHRDSMLAIEPPAPGHRDEILRISVAIFARGMARDAS